MLFVRLSRFRKLFHGFLVDCYTLTSAQMCMLATESKYEKSHTKMVVSVADKHLLSEGWTESATTELQEDPEASVDIMYVERKKPDSAI